MNDKKYKIGYTQGVFDMFHIGHLNLINNAKEYCEYLIVGVNSNKLVEDYKNKKPIINEKERLEIISNIKAVDKAVLVDTLDKKLILALYPFDAIFIGDDWKGNPRWEQTKKDMEKKGIDVIFLPYTVGICSSELRYQEPEKTEEAEEI